MLQVNSLSFDYGDKPILCSVQLSLNPGKLLHLSGGNGVGKTTLMRLLAGILLPTSGAICWENHSIHENLPSFQRKLCYLGHKNGLSPDLTVLENCYFDWHSHEAVDYPSLLERFDLVGLANKPCYQLSQGQQRRVALLRLAMTQATLWLLDEPLVGLDKSAIGLLQASLKQHLDNQGLVVITSHQRLPKSIGEYEEYSL